MAIDPTIIARIARQGGSKLLDRAVGQLVSGQDESPSAKRTIASALIGTALTRVATRSVPGAILVGGGLIAKAVYDRRKARKARPDPRDSEPGNNVSS